VNWRRTAVNAMVQVSSSVLLCLLCDWCQSRCSYAPASFLPLTCTSMAFQCPIPGYAKARACPSMQIMQQPEAALFQRQSLMLMRLGTARRQAFQCDEDHQEQLRTEQHRATLKSEVHACGCVCRSCSSQRQPCFQRHSLTLTRLATARWWDSQWIWDHRETPAAQAASYFSNVWLSLQSTQQPEAVMAPAPGSVADTPGCSSMLNRPTNPNTIKSRLQHEQHHDIYESEADGMALCADHAAA